MSRKKISETAESIFIGEDEYKPIVYRKKIIPDYFVSKSGKIISIKDKRKAFKFITVRNRMATNADGSKRISGVIFDVSVPKNFFNDYSYREHTKGSKRNPNELVTLAVHVVVAEVWLPFDDNLPYDMPICLKKIWKKLSSESREYIQSGIVIDHIDDDPTNNHAHNLQRCCTRNNNIYVKKANTSASGSLKDIESDVAFNKFKEEHLERFFVQ
jgi:hypothetical protein